MVGAATAKLREPKHVRTGGTDSKQDHQALLKAKYCPRVVAALCTEKQKNSCDLDLWPWIPI